MERIAINNLIKWNENKRRKPLIIWGTRQVGKTYLIKKIFAERFYKDHWLTMAHIIYQSYQLKEHITLPLIKPENENYRLFLSDIGMFSYQSGINAASFISNNRENTLSGIFFENFVASELIAKGNHLFYWKYKQACELEFIVESDNKLYPIDVKKGKGVINSLEKFSNHNKYEYAIKISSGNFGFNEDKRLFTIPFYYISFLSDDLASGNLNIKKGNVNQI